VFANYPRLRINGMTGSAEESNTFENNFRESTFLQCSASNNNKTQSVREWEREGERGLENYNNNNSSEEYENTGREHINVTTTRQK
jgi:hypothetical protein